MLFLLLSAHGGHQTPTRRLREEHAFRHRVLAAGYSLRAGPGEEHVYVGLSQADGPLSYT